MHAAACVSHLALRIAAGESVSRAGDPAWEEEVAEVVEGCRGMGGTMEAVARVLQASVVKEIVSAKYAFLCFFCTHTYDWSLLGET